MRFAAVAFTILFATPALAQDPAPKIGPFVVDVHGTVPRFPSEDTQFAESRGVTVAELPGAGFGLQLGAHVYVLRVKAITFGLGAELSAGRSHQTPDASAATATSRGSAVRASEERFSTISPQLSFNFGSGTGWSYLSGGIGYANWALVADNHEGSLANSENLRTINYGGGARWFAKPHLAFSFDVRFYALSPGTAYADGVAGPRTTLLVIGAGISLK